jgi:hypothetical protein
MSFVSTAPDATSESFIAQARLTRAATRANMVVQWRPQQCAEASSARRKDESQGTSLRLRIRV